jgi:16S rRNA (guanine966-N2)-methyltransferase
VRVVGGKFAGRDLTSPADGRVRPTAEPVRAALLDHLGNQITGARVLDLFAGTGALGIESLSRGAVSADFVEFRPASLHALRANVAALRLQKQSRIFKRDAFQFIATLERDRYQVAFADPPYGTRLIDRVVEEWLAQPFAATLAVEHARGHLLPRGVHRATFGDSAITIYRSR